jgi:hypothetical protein
VKYLADNHLGWVHGPEASIPEFTDYGYVRDRDGLIEDLRLWKTLVALRQERDKPFPPIKHIIPLLAALKNRFKKGVDSSSRYAKNVKAMHSKLTPTGQYLLRNINIRHLDVYFTECLKESFEYLFSEEYGPKTYEDYRQYVNQHCGSFKLFCLKLSKLDLDRFVNINSTFDDVGSESEDVVVQCSNVEQPKYKLAELANSDPHIRRIRTSRTAPPHALIATSK